MCRASVTSSVTGAFSLLNCFLAEQLEYSQKEGGLDMKKAIIITAAILAAVSAAAAGYAVYCKQRGY